VDGVLRIFILHYTNVLIIIIIIIEYQRQCGNSTQVQVQLLTLNNTLAVDELGNPQQTWDEKWGEGAVRLSMGAGSPSNISPGPRTTSVS